MKHRAGSTALHVLLIVAIVIGIGFRMIPLDHKIYWHDEVYTSMRAAGYTRREVDQTIFQNRLMAASDLQTFQQIKPGSSTADTLRSLRTEDPQHPPLYFMLARGWMHWFGGSIAASRSLPTILGLLGLPFMGLLALELFDSSLIAGLAVAFLALSPFDILFAQTARQYSLLTTVIIGSSWLLVRYVRRPSWSWWTGYTLSVAIGLYVHPFFALTVIAQGAFVFLMSILGAPTDHTAHTVDQSIGASSDASPQLFQLSNQSSKWFKPFQWKIPIRFLLAIMAALVLYIPWILVLSENYQRASSTTDWTRAAVGSSYLVKLWILSFTSLFNDIDFGFDNILTYLFRLPHLLLILVALYFVYRRSPKRTGLFIITSVLVPFLLLAIPDLVLGGKRSAVSRYLISCYPGIQLAAAYLIAIGLNHHRQSLQRFWQWVLCISLTISIISCGISAQAETWWNKDLSYYNAEVAQQVNAAAQTASPVVISDMGDDYTNMGDLISLSYEFQENVRLLLMSRSPDFSQLPNDSPIFVWRPSRQLKAEVENIGQLESINQPARLWKLQY